MKRSWLLLAIGATLGILALAACSDTSTEAPATTSAEGPSGSSPQVEPVTAPPEWEHVHNLALDDGQLLVGTHEGLWRQLPGRQPQLVSAPPFDVMGLALSGRRMLASGHPMQVQEGITDLGLQESSDGGVTWSGVSLVGEVDFHRLSASGRTLLGLSSSDGQLLRSTDAGLTWTDLGSPPLFDVVVNPENEDVAVGTTESGPVSSDDGGYTFTSISNAPLLAFLSWTSSQLYGVTPDGSLQRSTDDGASWKEVGQVSGQPAAIAAQGDNVVVLADETIFESTDGGATFTERIVGVAGH